MGVFGGGVIKGKAVATVVKEETDTLDVGVVALATVKKVGFRSKGGRGERKGEWNREKGTFCNHTTPTPTSTPSSSSLRLHVVCVMQLDQSAGSLSQ